MEDLDGNALGLAVSVGPELGKMEMEGIDDGGALKVGNDEGEALDEGNVEGMWLGTPEGFKLGPNEGCDEGASLGDLVG